MFDLIGEWLLDSPKKVQKLKDMTLKVISGPLNHKLTN